MSLKEKDKHLFSGGALTLFGRKHRHFLEILTSVSPVLASSQTPVLSAEDYGTEEFSSIFSIKNHKGYYFACHPNGMETVPSWRGG